MYICETCRKQVRPASESGIVFAVELRNVTGFSAGGEKELAEGRGVFFHDHCYPSGTSRYRQKPMPEGIDDGGD